MWIKYLTTNWHGAANPASLLKVGGAVIIEGVLHIAGAAVHHPEYSPQELQDMIWESITLGRDYCDLTQPKGATP